MSFYVTLTNIPFISQHTFFYDYKGMSENGIYFICSLIFSQASPFGYSYTINTLELTELNGSLVNDVSGNMLSLVVFAAPVGRVVKRCFQVAGGDKESGVYMN